MAKRNFRYDCSARTAAADFSGAAALCELFHARSLTASSGALAGVGTRGTWAQARISRVCPCAVSQGSLQHADMGFAVLTCPRENSKIVKRNGVDRLHRSKFSGRWFELAPADPRSVCFKEPWKPGELSKRSSHGQSNKRAQLVLAWKHNAANTGLASTVSCALRNQNALLIPLKTRISRS